MMGSNKGESGDNYRGLLCRYLDMKHQVVFGSQTDDSATAELDRLKRTLLMDGLRNRQNLMDLLGDERVGSQMGRIAGEIGVVLLPDLVQVLDRGSVAAKRNALEALEEMGAVAAEGIVAVVRLLKAPEENIRSAALTTLASMEDSTELIAHLRQGMRDQSESVRWTSLHLASHLDDPSALLDEVQSLLKERRLYAVAADVIAKAGRQGLKAIRPLAECVAWFEDGPEFESVCIALSKLMPESCIELASYMLKADESPERKGAALALCTIAGDFLPKREITSKLMEQIRATSEKDVTAAARALGALGHRAKDVVSELNDILGRTKEPMKSEIAAAIAAIVEDCKRSVR